MISIIDTAFIINGEYEPCCVEAYLSNGWIVQQPFTWELEAKNEITISYNDGDAKIIVGNSIFVDELTAEEDAAFYDCALTKSDIQVLKDAIMESPHYREAIRDFSFYSNPYHCYGVSEKDFISF